MQFARGAGAGNPGGDVRSYGIGACPHAGGSDATLHAYAGVGGRDADADGGCINPGAGNRAGGNRLSGRACFSGAGRGVGNTCGYAASAYGCGGNPIAAYCAAVGAAATAIAGRYAAPVADAYRRANGCAG